MKTHPRQLFPSGFLLITLSLFAPVTSARSASLDFFTNVVTTGGSVLLPRFDPSVGSLTEVLVSGYSSFSGGLTGFNNSDEPLQVSTPITAGISIWSPETFVSVGSFMNGMMSGTIPPQSSAFLTASAGPGLNQVHITDFADLANFTGTDPFTMQMVCTASVPGSFHVTLGVNYTYVVPEPSGLALLGLGAMALVLRRKPKNL
jgi:hypothetical protein